MNRPSFRTAALAFACLLASLPPALAMVPAPGPEGMREPGHP